MSRLKDGRIKKLTENIKIHVYTKELIIEHLQFNFCLISAKNIVLVFVNFKFWFLATAFMMDSRAWQTWNIPAMLSLIDKMLLDENIYLIFC